MEFLAEIKDRFQQQCEYLVDKNESKKQDPLVSVCVQTYQHEKFIERCLNGILMQKTDFSIEIILGEDDSGDKTRDICIEYAKKYPNKIRLFLRDRKLTQLKDQHGNLIRRLNGIFNRMSARGKYIALCEGDDYWTDPLKLQKQVDILERYPKYKLCSHNHVLKYEHKEIEPIIRSEATPHLLNKKAEKKDSLYEVTLQQYCKYQLTLHTHTLLFRKKDFEFPEWGVGFVSGDYVRIIELLKQGPAVYIDDLMGVSRKHPGGITQIKKSGEQVYDMTVHQLKKMIVELPENCRKYYRVRLFKTYIKMIIGYGKYKMEVRKRLDKIIDIIKF